jgi:hypothetical protein
MALTLAYREIPTEAQWLKDSSVKLAVRSKDQILTSIDSLMGAYHKYRHDPKASVILCDLFFTLDYWLKIYRTNSKMERARAPVIQALYECVVGMLCEVFNCTVNTLPRELELMFGRELSDQGVRVDLLNSLGKHHKAFYLEDRAQLALFKLRFKNGKAYQWRWWTKPAGGLVLANSNRVYSPGAGIGSVGKDYGYFIMTMSRDIYMMRHGRIKGTDYRIFHSTYLAGGAVMAAGSMLIEDGVIKRIRSDSGHYTPTNTNMFALLQALAMLGVRLEKITMEDYTQKELGKGTDFFKANADWSLLQGQRNQTLADNKRAFALRPGARGQQPQVRQPQIRRNSAADDNYN